MRVEAVAAAVHEGRDESCMGGPCMGGSCTGDVGRADWVAIVRSERVLVHVEVDLKVAAGLVVVNGVLVRPDLTPQYVAAFQ